MSLGIWGFDLRPLKHRCVGQTASLSFLGQALPLGMAGCTSSGESSFLLCVI